MFDKETKVNIGTVVVTANGDNQGGKARVTLKNLDEFQAKTGGDVVKGVKGNYAISFLFKSDQTATPTLLKTRVLVKQSHIPLHLRQLTASKKVSKTMLRLVTM